MSKYWTSATWEDCPHLSDAVKAELLASIPPFQREARSRGIPQLGAGAIYPVQIADITVPDFKIPKHWRKAYGLDVGWNWTAAIWGAWNEDTDTMYLWHAYKRGQAEPVVHVEAIRSAGLWIPGVNDPAAATKNQHDGRKLFDIYRGLGLNIEKADNAVSAGLLETWNRLSSGRLKVFASLTPWFAEFSLYHRNEKGVIVKEHDHLMDATRYLVMSGGKRAISEPLPIVPNANEGELVYATSPVGDLGYLGT